MNVEVKFPILGIKDNDSNVYVFSTHIGIVSKGGDTFYKDLWIVDCTGSTFQLVKSKIKGKAPFKYSIRYFQQMYEMELDFAPQSIITLDELRHKIFAHISKHKQKWDTLGPVKLIGEEMDKYNSMEQLFERFK